MDGGKPRYGRRRREAGAETTVDEAGVGEGKEEPAAAGSGSGPGEGWTVGSENANSWMQPASSATPQAVEDEVVDDNIVTIPDVDDKQDDDITTKVAHAPHDAARKVQSISELNDEARLAAPQGAAETAAMGIDLSKLTTVLTPPDQLREPDEPWDFNALLQEVSQEMQAEKDRREAEDAGLALDK